MMMIIIIKTINTIIETLKTWRSGHQTRRVFIQGKIVSEFVLILKMRLQVKSVQVEGEHGCVSFKNPVKTDLILDLYENSYLNVLKTLQNEFMFCSLQNNWLNFNNPKYPLPQNNQSRNQNLSRNS
ncbi:hypothetical protein TTHERM_01018430 (macronuclear) [Tetrahymena thermophila SB210]|uniref:Uncharacterized protein n=1 Tax=Tetrahymena thermophila (strain SB210) TaxID=312017 RepID=Q22XN4_TETTS|nr:hypothetical protein TTHERM_01018430 [Tetrahymena thermophila SB210]EAR90045.1 hypothetical protein TTHERM_01018430 [Tetrahymena thermophila SB210]|eukprot:XP_001010290.1 hypothetical protein TTHERM_01018430 [Tetrahymena thermophila SB210]